MEGKWIVERMKVVDGQSVSHIIEDAEGQLRLSFQDSVSVGFCNFELNIDSIIYPFAISFDGLDPVFFERSDGLEFGSDMARNMYKIILLTKRDLVLEYYDPLNFQLRKLVFVKEE